MVQKSPKTSCEQQWAEGGNAFPEEYSKTSWHEGKSISNITMVSRKASRHAQHIEAWGRVATTAEDHISSLPLCQEYKLAQTHRNIQESEILPGQSHRDHIFFSILMFDADINWSLYLYDVMHCWLHEWVGVYVYVLKKWQVSVHRWQRWHCVCAKRRYLNVIT